MTIRFRIPLIAIAFALSTVSAAPLLSAHQNNSNGKNTSKSGNTSRVRQEFGPQTASRRGDRMGVASNTGNGGSGVTASHAGKQNETLVKRRKVDHSKSDHIASSPSDKSASK